MMKGWGSLPEARPWILDSGYSILDTGYGMLDTGRRLLVSGHWFLVAEIVNSEPDLRMR